MRTQQWARVAGVAAIGGGVLGAIVEGWLEVALWATALWATALWATALWATLRADMVDRGAWVASAEGS